jgi:integral membrane protein
MRQQYAKQVESAQFFTDREAWNLFRLAAFGEAFGWTLLISSLVFKHYVTPGNNIPIDIAGQIHGTIFLVYIAAVVVLHPSLRWSPQRTLIAGLVSVPPYGTLMFEQWIAHKRRNDALASYRQLIVRGVIVRKGKLLATQPQDSGYWYLPGGVTEANETADVALQRIITQHTGIKPRVGRLVYVWQHKHNKVQQLELFFVITNAEDYQRIDLSATKRGHKDLDDISFVRPGKVPDLQPKFLQTITLPQPTTSSKDTVKFI